MAKTIRIEDWAEAARTEITLSGGRQVKLHRPVFCAHNQANWPARRPGWGNAKAATDAVLLRAGAGELNNSDLTELSERDRRRLIVAVVRLVDAEKDWRRLYGTSLRLNERFLATLIWAECREAHELQSGLRKMRERLRGRPESQVQAIPRGISAFTSVAKQMAAMNSFAQLAKVGLGPHFPALPGVALARELNTNNWLGSSLHATRTAETIKTSALDQVVLDKTRTNLTVAGLGERWRWGLAGAGFGEAPGTVAQMDILSFGKQLGAASLAAGLSTEISSIFKQDFTKTLGVGAFKPSISGALLSGRPFSLLPKLDPATFGLGSGLLRQTQTTIESLLMAKLAQLWGEDPLWFLIGYLNPRKLPALLERSRDEVYEAVLDGLEEIVRDSDLTEQLFAACEEIGFLTPEQREWLRHGLGHVREGEWVQAMPPLTWGFEGAIFNGAVEARAVSAREGKKLGAEAVIKAMELDEDLESFAIRLVFGGRGNAFRHGRPDHQARDQALLQIVALVGWVDFTLGTSGVAKLAHRLETPLSGVLGRTRRRELTTA